MRIPRITDRSAAHRRSQPDAPMKLVLLIVSSVAALRVIPAGMTRRAAINAAASVMPLVPLAAFAELKQASDAEVYARADDGKLNSARVIERAKVGKLVDGSGASCDELKKLIAVDKEALEFEKDKLEAMGGSDKAQKKVVADAEKAINAQVKKHEGKLNSARVIERAKQGKLVDGSGATCSELESLIAVDKKAVRFEKDKLEAMGGNDPAQKKIVDDAEKAIEAQVKKLQGKLKEKGR